MAIKAVKYSFGSDKRRVAGTVDFDKLCELVETAFGVKVGGDHLIQYTDEENESITINSQHDLEEAYQVVEADGRSSLQVRLVDVFNNTGETEWNYEDEQLDDHHSRPESVVESADEFEMVETASKFSSDDEYFPAGDVSKEEEELKEAIVSASQQVEDRDDDSVHREEDESEEEAVKGADFVVKQEIVSEEQSVEEAIEDNAKEVEQGIEEIGDSMEEVERVVEQTAREVEEAIEYSMQSESDEESAGDEKNVVESDDDEKSDEDESDDDEKSDEDESDDDEKNKVESGDDEKNKVESDDDEKNKVESDDSEKSDEEEFDEITNNEEDNDETNNKETENLVDSILEKVSDELSVEEKSKSEYEEKVKVQEEQLRETEELPPELIQALIDLEEERVSGQKKSRSKRENEGPKKQEPKSPSAPEPFNWEHDSENTIQGVVNGILGLVSSAQSTLRNEAKKNTSSGELAKSIGQVLDFVQKVATPQDETNSSDNATTRETSPSSGDSEESDSEESSSNASLFANLYEILSNSQVVQKIQNALAEPEINELVVSIAMLYSTEKEPSGQQLMAVILSRACSLLQWLHRLATSIPELLMATPQLAAYILSMLRSSFGEPKSNCRSNQARFRCGPFRGRGRRWGLHSRCSKQSESPQNSSESPQRNPDSEKPTHFGVYCDGCNQNKSNEMEAVQRGTLELETRYIQGVRYKSAVAEDFDLCSTCESTGKFHCQAPFLKIETPDKAPRSIVCVLAEGDEQCGFPRSGLRPFRRSCRARRQWRERVNQHLKQHVPNRGNKHCFMEKVVDGPHDLERGLAESFAQMKVSGKGDEVVSTAESVQGDSKPPMAKKDDSQLYCPQKHPLTVHTTIDSRYFCDVCNSRIGSNQEVYGCRRCDWDVCAPCMTQKEESNHTAAPEALPADLPAASAATAVPRRQQQQPKPQARFVSILSLPDGSVVKPGEQIRKVWRIQNTGSCSWPEGCRMVCVGGERMNGPSSGVVLPTAQSGQTVDVSLPLRAPARPGRYVAYWRFITGSNVRFGHRFWVDITVQGHTPEVLASSVMQPLRSALDAWNSPSTSVQAVTNRPTRAVTGTPVLNEARVAQQTSSSDDVPSTPELHRRFSDELTKMADMGFCDLDKNATLLNKHNGRVDLAITDIMDSAYLDVVDRGL